MPKNFTDQLMNFGRKLASAPMPAVTELRGDVVGGAGSIVKDKNYFALTLNQINLAEGRQWWTDYDPLVYLAVDFQYGGERLSIPKLIGPTALRASLPDDKPLPHGLLVRDIRVGPAVPFRGGPISITMVLYKVSTDDYARRVLQIAESLSAALGVTALANIAKVGDVVLDGLQALFSMQEVQPLLGQRLDLTPDVLKGLAERQVALVDGASSRGQALKIDSNRLVDATGAQYSKADFLVYSLWSTSSVESDMALPFYPDVLKMYDTASAGDDMSWERAKAALITLYQRLRSSPDLVTADADRLFESYKGELLNRRETIKKAMLMGKRGTREAKEMRSLASAETAQLNSHAAKVFGLQ